MRTLKRARELFGCIQKQFAKFVGVTSPTMQNFEACRSHLQQCTHEKIEKKLRFY